MVEEIGAISRDHINQVTSYQSIRGHPGVRLFGDWQTSRQNCGNAYFWGIIYVFTLNDQSTTLQVGDMLLVIAYATFGHSRPSGHLVCRDVAYKDRTRRRFFSGNSMRGGSKCMFQELIWTRRRVLIAYCLRRGVCSDSKCCTSCLLRNVMLHLVRMANFTPTHTYEELH